MKHLGTTWILALLLALVPLLAFGSEQHKSLNLTEKATVGTQQLKPGQYTVRFDDSKSQTKVEFQQDGKTIATAPATVKHATNMPNATYEMNTANGQDKLDRIYVGKNEALVFGNAGQASSPNQSSTPPTR